MPLDLTHDERVALVRLLCRTLDDDPYPMAPRLDPLKAILAKLEPPGRDRNLGRRCGQAWHHRRTA